MGRIENPDLKRLRSEPLVGTVLLQIERNGALFRVHGGVRDTVRHCQKRDLTTTTGEPLKAGALSRRCGAGNATNFKG
jgi:hypothetical protein